MALLCLAGASPAAAAVSQAQLNDVRVEATPGGVIPLSLSFIDDNGKPRTLGQAIGRTPAVLIFADYTCTNLCGPILSFAAAGLEKSNLMPGKDFHLVVIGLDPKDDIKEARALKASRIGSDTPLAGASVVLTGNQEVIRTATEAAGYHYVYDADHDQFAHPAAAYVLTREGRITRVLSGLGVSGGDLRLALVDAGQGRVGSLLDQIRLRCFGFDAALGVYTASISRLLTIAGAVTVALVFGAIALMTIGMRRRAQP